MDRKNVLINLVIIHEFKTKLLLYANFYMVID